MAHDRKKRMTKKVTREIIQQFVLWLQLGNFKCNNVYNCNNSEVKKRSFAEFFYCTLVLIKFLMFSIPLISVELKITKKLRNAESR